MSRAPHPIYNLPFGLISLSSLLFSASYNMLIPALPAYLTGLGGAHYKGFIIALFTLTAGLSRPFSGKLADTVGRVPVMAVGSLVCVACGLVYPLVPFVAGFLALRLVHGFSTGFKPTGTTAYVADLVPPHRRGEAMGLQGLCAAVGMALGPVVGSWVSERYSMNALFYTSSVSALLSIVIIGRMHETLVTRVPFRWSLLRVGRHDFFEPRALPPAVATLLTYVGLGVVLTLIPDWSKQVGVANGGWFFTVFTVASLGMRLLGGRVSDRYGRVMVLRVANGLLASSLLLVGLAHSPTTLMGAAALFGIASGVGSPALLAWTVDLSHPNHRGRALATMYIALEVGIGGGALLAGWLAGENPARSPLAFFAAAVASLASLIYLMLYRPHAGKEATQPASLPAAAN